MTIEALKVIEKEIEKLEKQGKNISISNKVKLKKLQKSRDKVKSPIEASAIFVPKSENSQEVRDVEISKIMMPKFNDRTGIDDNKIRELAQSIKLNGLIQPIVLMESEEGTFVKISGRRRILATQYNNEAFISAIIKPKNIEDKAFNLLVLHENTQREDLSIYDKVRFMLEFIQNALMLQEIEIKKILYQINNFEKGTIKENKALKEQSILLKEIFEETNLFSSVQHFLKYLPILEMNISIRELLDSNKIIFGMALLFNQYEEKDYQKPYSFETLIKEIITNEMSIKEAKIYLQSKLFKEEIVKNSVNEEIKDKLSKIKKLSLLLVGEDKQRLDEELGGILGRYF
jgi:ParB family chromosome partitioning protein